MVMSFSKEFLREKTLAIHLRVRDCKPTIIYTISLKFSSTPTIKLNLFNHVLALFHAKFACNLAIRYPVFRWELCKGSV